jgi:hypothetical protein
LTFSENFELAYGLLLIDCIDVIEVFLQDIGLCQEVKANVLGGTYEKGRYNPNDRVDDSSLRSSGLQRITGDSDAGTAAGCDARADRGSGTNI